MSTLHLKAVTAIIVSTAAGMLAVHGSARSQPVVQEITANPEAKPLRQIWTVYGNDTLGGARVGLGIGGVGDVNSDGLMDFAVNWGAAGEWRIFYGSRDSISHTPAQVFKHYGTVPYHPVVGDFWGTGHKAVGFPRETLDAINPDKRYFQLHIFRTDSSSIDTVESAILDTRVMNPVVRFAPKEITGADLDGDGADELILFVPGVFRNDVAYPNPEIWIYRGGPDFQLDTPTVVIRDSEANGGSGNYQLIVGMLDHDHYADLATRLKYPDGNYKLKIWFGDPNSPWSWTTPQRTIPFGGIDMTWLDCDGDSVLDFAVPDGSSQVAVFFSNTGKSLRDRSLDASDIDKLFLKTDSYAAPYRLGYLNDSLHRYEMLGIVGAQGLIGLSGAGLGPNSSYDTYYSGEDVYTYTIPVGDVTGDGYDDFLTSNFDYGLQSGIAALFAGGPYIPHDWQTSAVDQIAVTGESGRISIWPNPLGNELHIGWSTDRLHTPERFVVHDVLGREIARGTVESASGMAHWRCDGLAAGTYLLTIFDHDGRCVAAARLMKQ